MRTVRIILWGLVLLVGAVVGGVSVGRLIAGRPVVVAASPVGAALIRARYENAGGPFRMTDVDGATVTEADFAGKPLAMFFGFTHCPDVCPTAMVDAGQWLRALGPDADKLSVVFVTVDPERDTPAVLKQYLGAFDGRIVGLVPPSEAALAGIAESYQIRYEKVAIEDGSYTMNHTADTLLFDAAGKYAGFIPFTPFTVRQDPSLVGGYAGDAVAKLRELVSS